MRPQSGGEGFVWLLVPHKARKPTWQKCWASIRANHFVLRHVGPDRTLGRTTAVPLPGADVVSLDSLLASDLGRWLASLEDVFGFEVRLAEVPGISARRRSQAPIVLCVQKASEAQAWVRRLSAEAQRKGSGWLVMASSAGANRPEKLWCSVDADAWQLHCFNDPSDCAAGRRPQQSLPLSRACIQTEDNVANEAQGISPTFAKVRSFRCPEVFLLTIVETSSTQSFVCGVHHSSELKKWLEALQTLCRAGALRKSFGSLVADGLDAPRVSWNSVSSDAAEGRASSEPRRRFGERYSNAADESTCGNDVFDYEDPFERLAKLRPSFCAALQAAVQTAAEARASRLPGKAEGTEDDRDVTAFSMLAESVASSHPSSSEAASAVEGVAGESESRASDSSGEETHASSSAESQSEELPLHRLQCLAAKLQREGRRLEKTIRSSESVARTTLAFFGESVGPSGGLAALQAFLAQVSSFARDFALAVKKVKEHHARKQRSQSLGLSRGRQLHQRCGSAAGLRRFNAEQPAALQQDAAVEANLGATRLHKPAMPTQRLQQPTEGNAQAASLAELMH